MSKLIDEFIINHQKILEKLPQFLENNNNNPQKLDDCFDKLKLINQKINELNNCTEKLYQMVLSNELTLTDSEKSELQNLEQAEKIVKKLAPQILVCQLADQLTKQSKTQ
jgi:uncharacterized protein YoxC